jgi:hypothetical protein
MNDTVWWWIGGGLVALWVFGRKSASQAPAEEGETEDATYSGVDAGMLYIEDQDDPGWVADPGMYSPNATFQAEVPSAIATTSLQRQDAPTGGEANLLPPVMRPGGYIGTIARPTLTRYSGGGTRPGGCANIPQSLLDRMARLTPRGRVAVLRQYANQYPGDPLCAAVADCGWDETCISQLLGLNTR